MASPTLLSSQVQSRYLKYKEGTKKIKMWLLEASGLSKEQRRKRIKHGISCIGLLEMAEKLASRSEAPTVPSEILLLMSEVIAMRERFSKWHAAAESKGMSTSTSNDGHQYFLGVLKTVRKFLRFLNRSPAPASPKDAAAATLGLGNRFERLEIEDTEDTQAKHGDAAQGTASTKAPITASTFVDSFADENFAAWCLLEDMRGLVELAHEAWEPRSDKSGRVDVALLTCNMAIVGLRDVSESYTADFPNLSSMEAIYELLDVDLKGGEYDDVSWQLCGPRLAHRSHSTSLRKLVYPDTVLLLRQVLSMMQAFAYNQQSIFIKSDETYTAALNIWLMAAVTDIAYGMHSDNVLTKGLEDWLRTGIAVAWLPAAIEVCVRTSIALQERLWEPTNSLCANAKTVIKALDAFCKERPDASSYFDKISRMRKMAAVLAQHTSSKARPPLKQYVKEAMRFSAPAILRGKKSAAGDAQSGFPMFSIGTSLCTQALLYCGGIDMCNDGLAVVIVAHLYRACLSRGAVKEWNDIEALLAHHSRDLLLPSTPRPVQHLVHANQYVSKCR